MPRSGGALPRAGDTSRVERRLIPGHSPYEPVVGVLACCRQRSARARLRHCADPARRRPPDRRLRTGSPVPRDRRRCAGRGRGRLPGRRANSDLFDRRRRLRGGRACARQGVFDDPARVDRGRRQGPARPALAGRGRGRRSAGREADLSQLDHRQGRCPGREHARPHVRPVRPVHARRRGGVHAPRRRDVRPRPAHRHGAAGDLGPRVRAPNQRRADAVGARDRDARVQDHRGRPARAPEAAERTSARSGARRACA